MHEERRGFAVGASPLGKAPRGSKLAALRLFNPPVECILSQVDHGVCQRSEDRD